MTEENGISDAKEILDQFQKEKARLNDEIYTINNQLNQLQSEKDQMENEAKAPIIQFLGQQSRGAYHAEDLQKLDLATLKKLKGLFVDAAKTGYDEIMAKRQAARDAEDQRRPKVGTGTYNQETHLWEGGLEVPEKTVDERATVGYFDSESGRWMGSSVLEVPKKPLKRKEE